MLNQIIPNPEGMRNLNTYTNSPTQRFLCLRTNCALTGRDCLARKFSNNVSCKECETGNRHDELFGDDLVGTASGANRVFNTVQAKRVHDCAVRIIDKLDIDLHAACEQMGVSYVRFRQPCSTWTINFRQRVSEWIKENRINV